MENPFPGMDPWMEDQWGDAHHRLIVYASDALRESLPPDLRPRVAERVFVESPFDAGRGIYPDLRVVEHARIGYRPPEPARTQGAVATAKSVIIEVSDDPITEGFIEIIDLRSGGRVVTIIGVLSAANKRPGEGQQLYLKKQSECKEASVNLVEIDLLRGGQYVLAAPKHWVPQTCAAPYRISTWRASRRGAYEMYKTSLRRPLPTIRIPLRTADEEVPLALQPLLNLAYRNGSYDETNYRSDPKPPLDEEDMRWATELLRAKGLR